ncbi:MULTISPECIES: SGNH/GDSL hydrolase family protein [unclassified Microbacterium]|uniref:SGNH/GDSL hydrolase family protein n=1 Tax=unclassified Microbacterium TaxID=2609290 RepID=UPI000EA8D813|nr:MULTISPECIES: SGNH/GDSL hydrolase family protein [unclassified Microbacterium]MBT2485007.1 SGNH/GDSL hydrolase family protein [Microbacterium sp. ISL-108]RKN67857.1 SGNH/GDSL hydrolase family protein [Microbacterium sp. CGR2]
MSGRWRCHVGGLPRRFGLSASAALLAFTVGTLTACTAPDPRPSTRPSLEHSGVDAVRDVIANDDRVVISVIGDSTGNDTDEWVAGWAEHLTRNDATVVVNFWDPTAGAYKKRVVYGRGEREVVIWNGSVPGQPADAALPILEKLQPESPNLIIYNFGHNDGTLPTGTALQKLTTAALARWGSSAALAATLQNPGTGAQAAESDHGRRSVAEWARLHDVPTIDVYAAFIADPQWATDLMRDAAHPNEIGSRLWAETVADTLG